MKNILQRAALVAVSLGAVLAAPAHAEIVASEAWSRATVPGASVGAGYLVLKNTGDETRSLLRITSPVCDTIMLHQSSVDSQGVAHMWPVAKLELKAGESVRFDPNGRHVMFMDLKGPFVVGTKVPLLLQFDGGEREMTVLLEVRPLVDSAPLVNHAQRKH